MKKVLIITYYWPPSGGAGVQRWLKFAKYLPEFEWEPVILTVDPEKAAYPALDPSLENELSPDLEVYKTSATDWFRIYSSDKSKVPSAGFATSPQKNWKGKISRFIRGNFFIPDPRRGWNRFAFRKACELIDKNKIVTIVTTSPPHSTQLIGLKIKKKYPGIKWIADLRDPWTDIYYYDQFYHTPIAKMIDRYYEKHVLNSSDRIITVGNSLKELLSAKTGSIGNKISVIPNGFDADDFESINPVNPEEFTISYIGTLSDSYPISGFLQALSGYISDGINLKLKLIGTVSPSQMSLIRLKMVDSSVEIISYVNHKSAIRHMMESSVLLLIIPDHPSNRSIITGKIFEYMATGKPILCIGPDNGDASEIIRSTKHGLCAGYDDSQKIRLILDEFYNSADNYEKSTSDQFSRKTLTGKLAEQF